jgi:hypothetical protein
MGWWEDIQFIHVKPFIFYANYKIKLVIMKFTSLAEQIVFARFCIMLFDYFLIFSYKIFF